MKECIFCGSEEVHEQYKVCSECYSKLTPDREYENKVMRETRFGHSIGPHIPRHFNKNSQGRKLLSSRAVQIPLQKSDDLSQNSYLYHGDNLRDDAS